ncbi:cytochrome P450-dit2 [Ceratobasidium sp. 392]|nr:cytochrome P450-dit2 [Ceratobasidium sp. 392]
MSQSPHASKLEEFLRLFIRAGSQLQNDPIQAVVALVGALVIGYTIKKLVTPSYYSNIDGPPGGSLIYGHMLDLFSPFGLPFHDHLQDTYGSVSKVKGMFGSDQLYISDPRALHEILVKEHESVFRHIQFHYDFNKLSFGPGILAVTGDVHKAQRKASLDWIFRGTLSNNRKKLDVKSCVYCKTHEWFVAKVLLCLILAELISKYQVSRFHLIAQDLKDAITNELRDKNSNETDLLSWCNITALELVGQAVKANADATESERLPEDQLLGQMNTLIFAGHETTSGALARVLHLLAQNRDMQGRLRAEINDIPPTAGYEQIHSLPYLDAVCREVLRIYPPGVIMERQPAKDWVIPLRYPIKGKDGSELREIKVKKGTLIYLGVREANRCKETWGADADVFWPERWLDTLPSSVSDARTPGVYSSMMTFSAGPRACIGFKFSLLELKIVLLTLIRSFEFSPSKTPVEWRMTGAMGPYEVGAKEHGENPKLPLCVSVIA